MSSVRDTILDNMATALDAVSGITKVYRAREAGFDLHETTALQIVDKGDGFVRMLNCYEAKLFFEIRIRDKDYAKDELRDTLATRRAAVQAALTDNETWSGYAVETTLNAADESLGEAMDPAARVLIDGYVLYRTQVNDPTKVMVL